MDGYRIGVERKNYIHVDDGNHQYENTIIIRQGTHWGWN